MEQEIDRIVQAIGIAFDQSQISLHQQALEYISSIQQNSNETWRLALKLFVDQNADGTRKYPAQARFFALRVLDEFLDNRFERFDDESFATLQQALISYIQSEYVLGAAEADATFLRNKFSHTLTLFFLCTYEQQWPTFFSDLFTLIRPPDQSPQQGFNRHVSLLFFHIVLEISGEVADQIIKSARSFSAARHARDAKVRDGVRDRDAGRINEAVLTIVAEGAERMDELRKNPGAATEPRELDHAIEVVDWGVRTFGSYVGWIDINLTVTPTTVPLLFTLLADPSLPIRLATSVALLRIVSKGLKEPSDKLQLLKVLSLGQQLERGEDTDEGEESYREALGKLLNVLGQELAKLIDECSNDEIRAEASTYLLQIQPVMLHFLADEYDDTCSTVFPLLHIILAGYKRTRKMSTEPLDDTKRAFLTSLLEVILTKMKWDAESDPDDADEDDIAEFDKMRKDLRTFLDSILSIDQNLVTNAVRTLALNTISAYQSGTAIKWNDAELGIYLFTYLEKSTKVRSCCLLPSSCCGQGQPEDYDYSEYPLTTHGEVLFALFFETVSRYTDFFKIRKECIIPTLEAMVDTRGLHNDNSQYRSRMFYLFHRFIKELKHAIPVDICTNIIDSMRDLLPIVAEIPEPEEPEMDVLTEAITNSSFDSQLYLSKPIPDYPSIIPDNYIFPPLEVFAQMAQAILVCLEAMNVFKPVRDADSRNCRSTVTHSIPPLMSNLLAHFEPSELVDFMNFIGLLIHKLNKDMFDVLDQLIGPLSAHIATLLSQPITGTDDQRLLALLNNIMVSKLQGIFISEREKFGGFESLIATMQRLAEDVLDPTSQKSALIFLSRCVTVWGQPAEHPRRSLPGFERFIYERLVPTAFRVPSLPNFNLKDGQMTVVLHEIANLLQTICKTRGAESYTFFLNVFLPSQNWPPQTALDFTTKLRDLDSKNFRKYFTDLIRSSRAPS
ncbi:armadillo-type protein [Flammula alnicola]|nr:armadillo-type protein [Flammula alnicola]